MLQSFTSCMQTVQQRMRFGLFHLESSCAPPVENAEDGRVSGRTCNAMCTRYLIHTYMHPPQKDDREPSETPCSMRPFSCWQNRDSVTIEGTNGSNSVLATVLVYFPLLAGWKPLRICRSVSM